MKSSKQKNSEDMHSATSPFFQKKGEVAVAGDDSFFNKSSGSQNNNNTAVQKKCATCDEEEKVQKKEGLSVQKKAGDGDATPPPPPAAEPTKDATAPAASAFHFIAEDNATPEKGQMAKGAFMERLKSEVCETVDSALAGTPFSADNCPYIRASFAKHAGSSPAQIEALIIRYCPAAANASSAEAVIGQMKVRVYAAAVQWAKSGSDLSGAAQIFGGIASGIGDAVGSVASGISNAAGSIASGISNLFFKESAGGAVSSQSPETVMQSLGKGSSIDSGTKSKMEGAFDSNFSNVEIHTDSNAAQLSKSMNARAFAVGNHIAFAGGEYQPGTMMGDALMAHELAHTIQQNGGLDQKNHEPSNTESLENDADHSAVEAVSSIWGKGNPDQKENIKPKVKKGLSISRCKSTPAPAVVKKSIHEMDLKELNEIILHPEKYSIGEVGAAKARAMMLEHQEAITKTGTGTMQGNKCSTPASSGVEKTDCTNYVLDVLKFAFTAKGQGTLWSNITADANTNSNGPKYGAEKGLKGTELINSLVTKAGWKALFWSPDPRNPSDSISEHPDAYKKVKNTGKYYGIPVEKEDSVVDYRRTSAAATKNTTMIEKLKKVPLAVIGAKGGRHMTVLINGIVYEVHWDKPETDPNVVEATALENWGWNSGVLVMPEGDYKTAFKGE